MASFSRHVFVALCLCIVVAGQELLLTDFTPYTDGIEFGTDGKSVTLSLQSGQSASVMGSKTSWLYGSIGAWIKLPGGNAAGTVATLYLSSPFPQQCEFDFEFLGHILGGPRKIHTNVFVDGEGGREQQIYFPEGIEPTASFHYYSFEWHEDQVVFYVDWKPIRQFKNLKGIVSNGTYCDHKAMGLYLSIWDGSSWATEGGEIKIDWSEAPFNCYYSNFNFDGCIVNGTAGTAECQNDPHAAPKPLTAAEVQYMKDIRSNTTLVKYNYCTDTDRYPDISVSHPECAYNAM